MIHVLIGGRDDDDGVPPIAISIPASYLAALPVMSEYRDAGSGISPFCF